MSDMPKRPMLATPTEERTYVRRLKERVRALAAENARLGLVNGDAWRQRAEKAEAALAAFGRHVLEDHRVGTPGYDQMMVMARAAGRDSGGTKTEVSPAGNTAPSRGSGDRGQPSGLGQKSAAAKSAARHPENQECGT